MLNEWSDRQPVPAWQEWLLRAEATVIVAIQVAAILSTVAAYV